MSDKKVSDQENRAATAEPWTIALGEEKFTLSPMTKKDWSKIRDFCRLLAKANVRNPLLAYAEVAKDLDPESKMILAKEAVAQSAGAKVPEPNEMAIAGQIESTEGIAYQFYISASKAHPELTFEKAKKICTDEFRTEILEGLGWANGIKPDVDPKANGSAGS